MIDGMKLFNLCNEISRDINIRYSKQKLEFIIKNQRDNINKLMTLIDSLESVEKDAN